ncbi:hypothetical protein [Deinococcus yunweiensis]|uniref:hypothetical protein n=1 Tax=Deinococcus yunweiensis TaxID=367282 RepID=UPI00398E68F4
MGKWFVLSVLSSLGSSAMATDLTPNDPTSIYFNQAITPERVVYSATLSYFAPISAVAAVAASVTLDSLYSMGTFNCHVYRYFGSTASNLQLREDFVLTSLGKGDFDFDLFVKNLLTGSPSDVEKARTLATACTSLAAAGSEFSSHPPARTAKETNLITLPITGRTDFLFLGKAQPTIDTLNRLMLKLFP